MSIILQGSWETGAEGWLQHQMGSPTPLIRVASEARTGSYSVQTEYSNIFYPLPEDARNSILLFSVWQKEKFPTFNSDVSLYIGQYNQWGDLDINPDYPSFSYTLTANGPYIQMTGQFEFIGAPEGLFIVFGGGQNSYADDWRIEYEPIPTTSTYARHSGIWKPAEKYVKHDGIWKPAETKVRHGGIWKDV